jgi:NTP pyrophosphatase (non-canonical NTP hydrolase)
MDQSNTIENLAVRLQRFAADRDWEQFHNPKNLAISVSIEAGELLELFQWLTPDQAAVYADLPSQRERLAEEMADILIYLVRLTDVVGIELLDAALRKVALNESRYPVEKVKGSAVKRDPN